MSGPWAQYGQQGDAGQHPYGQRPQDWQAWGSPQGPVPGSSAPYGAQPLDGAPYGPRGYPPGQLSGGPFAGGNANRPNPTAQLPYPQFPDGAIGYGQNPYLSAPLGPSGFGTQNPYDQGTFDPGGPFPVPGAPAPRNGRPFALLAAVAVLVAIAVTATVVLLGSKAGGTAGPGIPGPMTTSVLTPVSSTAGVRPFPTPSQQTSTTSDDTTSDDTTSDESTTSDDTGTSDDTSTDGPTDTGSGAARSAADDWVAAINSMQAAAAKALSCENIQSEITTSFMEKVNGSLQITSVSTSGSAGTLRFTYRKTTDTSTRNGSLSMTVQDGSWKICD